MVCGYVSGGDWQNTDAKGNLIQNEHLRLLERLIEEATKRDIYMLLSPIVTYNSQWPEMTDSTNTGFMNVYSKADLILEPVAKEAQKELCEAVAQPHQSLYRT